MKTITKGMLVIIVFLFLACEEDSPFLREVAALKIVNSTNDIGTIEVRDFEGNISFASRNLIRLRSNSKFTLPTNTPTSVVIVPELDTLNIILNEAISLDKSGGIYSLFLLGDLTRVESLLIEDNVISPIQDSIVGVRFANLSLDSGSVSVVNLGEREEELINGLEYKDFSNYIPLPATVSDESYSLEFRDNSGNVLANVTLDPFQRRNESVLRNLTLALTGLVNDGTSSSSLAVIRVNNY